MKKLINLLLEFLYHITNPSFYWILNYKISNYFFFNKVLKPFYYIYWPFWRIISMILWIEIYWKTKIWNWLKIVHFWWIFINPNSFIWKNCIIYNNVTIWWKEYEWVSKCPKIWNNVKIGSWVKILWEIILWNNVSVWANSVVTKSFPDNCTIWWIPAKIIK